MKFSYSSGIASLILGQHSEPKKTSADEDEIEDEDEAEDEDDDEDEADIELRTYRRPM